MMRCEDEKMFYRPPLLEEPCAQTLSGIKNQIGRTKKEEENIKQFMVMKMVLVMMMVTMTISVMKMRMMVVIMMTIMMTIR